MNPSVTNNAQIYRRVKNGDIKGLLGLVCPKNLGDLSLVHSEVETNFQYYSNSSFVKTCFGNRCFFFIVVLKFVKCCLCIVAEYRLVIVLNSEARMVVMLDTLVVFLPLALHSFVLSIFLSLSSIDNDNSLTMENFSSPLCVDAS